MYKVPYYHGLHFSVHSSRDLGTLDVIGSILLINIRTLTRVHSKGRTRMRTKSQSSGHFLFLHASSTLSACLEVLFIYIIHPHQALDTTYLLNSVNPVISCLLALTGISNLTVLRNWFIIPIHPLHPQSVACPNAYKHIECAQTHRTQVQTLVRHPSFQILPTWILQTLSRKYFSVPSPPLYLHCQCLRQDDSPGLFTSLLLLFAALLQTVICSPVGVVFSLVGKLCQ